MVLEEEFARFDLNGDGYISTKEFRKTLKEAFDLTFSDSQYKVLLNGLISMAMERLIMNILQNDINMERKT